MIGFHVSCQRNESESSMTFDVKQNGYSDILLLPFLISQLI